MPKATKKHRYATIAPHPVRTAPRDAAWADSPEAVVAGCLASRGVLERRRGCPEAAEALGAACVILRDRGFSWPEIGRACGLMTHSRVFDMHRAYVARLFAEDRETTKEAVCLSK